MSENQVSNENSSENTSSAQDEMVPKKAYVEVSTDMHKWKQIAKGATAELEETKKQIMAENQRYKELWEAAEKKAAEAIEIKESERRKFLEVQKQGLLLQELGGLAKPEYIKHANLNTIEVDDSGNINMDSIKREAVRFKQEHSILLKNRTIPAMSNDAPKTITKPVSSMTVDEKKNQLRDAVSKIIGA